MGEKNITIEQYKEAVNELNFDCVDVNELYKIRDMRNTLVGKDIRDEVLFITLTDRGRHCLNYIDNVMCLKPAYPNNINDPIEHRPTCHEGSILCKNDEHSTVFVSLFVNGNNGYTTVSDESLQPIMNYIRYVEHLGGKAFISGAYSHSDVYYYAVTTIFWNN